MTGTRTLLEQQRVSVEERRPVDLRPQPIAVTSIGSSATTIYANTGPRDFLIVSLWVSNITGTAATLTLHAVPAGGSAGDGNAIVKGFSIAANSAPIVLCSDAGLRFRLQPGRTLSGLGSTGAALNVGGWGFEVFGGGN